MFRRLAMLLSAAAALTFSAAAMANPINSAVQPVPGNFGKGFPDAWVLKDWDGLHYLKTPVGFMVDAAKPTPEMATAIEAYKQAPQAYTAYLLGKSKGSATVHPLGQLRKQTRGADFVMADGSVVPKATLRLCKGGAKPDLYAWYDANCLLAFGMYFNEAISEVNNPQSPSHGGMYRSGDSFKGRGTVEYRYPSVTITPDFQQYRDAPSRADNTGIDAFGFSGLEWEPVDFRKVVARYDAQDRSQGGASAATMQANQARAHDEKIARLAASPKKSYECEMDRMTRLTVPYDTATVRCVGLFERTGLTFGELKEAGFEFVSSTPHGSRSFATMDGGVASEHRLLFVVRLP